MISALERLQQRHAGPLPDKMAAFGIAGGLGSGLEALLHDAPAARGAHSRALTRARLAMSRLAPMTGTAIVWFRRDLRLADNPALAAACERGRRVVALYIHAPDEEGDWQPGAASRWWLHHSLERLAASPARPRRRASRPARADARRRCSRWRVKPGPRRSYWNRLYEPRHRRKRRAIAAGLRRGRARLPRASMRRCCVEPWETRTGTGRSLPRVHAVLALLRAPVSSAAASAARAPATIAGSAVAAREPRARRTRAAAARPLGRRACTPHGRPARNGALAPARGILRARRWPATTRVATAPTCRTRRASRPTCTSARSGRGSASPRSATRRPIDPAARGARGHFLREIGWREFAHHLLHHFPHTPTEPLDERFDAVSVGRRTRHGSRRGSAAAPAIPSSTPGMRELWTTGWMHNRVRMIVASLLTKNLRQPWLEGRALVLGHAGGRRPRKQHARLAVDGRLRRRRRALFPCLQPMPAGRTPRSRTAATCVAGSRTAHAADLPDRPVVDLPAEPGRGPWPGTAHGSRREPRRPA